MLKIFDGAMGTMLQAQGLTNHECPEYYAISHPEIVAGIHRQYRLAGADILESNSFGGSPMKLAHFGLADQTEKINAAAARVARQAANGALVVWTTPSSSTRSMDVSAFDILVSLARLSRRWNVHSTGPAAPPTAPSVTLPPVAPLPSEVPANASPKS